MDTAVTEPQYQVGQTQTPPTIDLRAERRKIHPVMATTHQSHHALPNTTTSPLHYHHQDFPDEEEEAQVKEASSVAEPPTSAMKRKVGRWWVARVVAGRIVQVFRAWSDMQAGMS